MIGWLCVGCLRTQTMSTCSTSPRWIGTDRAIQTQNRSGEYLAGKRKERKFKFWRENENNSNSNSGEKIHLILIQRFRTIITKNIHKDTLWRIKSLTGADHKTQTIGNHPHPPFFKTVQKNVNIDPWS